MMGHQGIPWNPTTGLSQSISDGFGRPGPGSRAVLSTVDFSEAFDSVWRPALFHGLISAGLPPCFARWTQSFLSDGCASVVFRNHGGRSFRVRRGVPRGSILGPVLFSLFIGGLPASLPSFVGCSLCAGGLAVWSSSPRSLLRWGPRRELCFDWSAGLSAGVFLSVRANVGPPSSRWIPTKLASSPTSSCSAPASILIPLRLFLGPPSTALFPFLSTYLRWGPGFSHVSGPCTVSLLPHGAPLGSPSLFCVDLFFGPFSHVLHLDGFLS